MSRGEELWGHFYSADEDRDQGINSKELQDYLTRNKTNTGKHKSENDKLRMLCLAALIEEADVDKNNKMEFPEFRRIMKDSFTPSRKGKTDLWYCIHTAVCCSVQCAWQ